jgi:uncharacterized integral membrane protein (TIGR00698 family)
VTDASRRPAGGARALVPGVAAAITVGLAGRLVAGSTGPWVTEVPAAVAIGLVVGHLMPVGPSVVPGLRHVVRHWLRVGIVLLGAQLSIDLVLELGAAALALVVMLVLGTLAVVGLLGRALGIDPRISSLVAVGTAICGNTAILATAPLVAARERDIAFAVALITLSGTVAVLLYPLLGGSLGLEQVAFGIWAGTAVNDTSQVVATGFAYGQSAGETATVVKLARNLMLAPVLFAIAVRAPTQGKVAAAPRPRYREAVPLFVIGFGAMALLASVGALDARVGGRDLVAWCGDAARLLILVALAGVGLSTRLGALREVGRRPFYLAVAGAVMLSVTSLALVLALGFDR